MVITAFIGTYADKIIALEIDAEKKRFGAARTLAELPSPSYLTVADGKYLVACSETERFLGMYGGGLTSFAILPAGGLRELSKMNAGGTVTCHVAFDADSRKIAAANYGDGSFSVMRLGANGILSEPRILVKHAGSGPDKQRQSGPHAHQCVFAPDGTLWVCDLGLDMAIQYKLTGGGAEPLRRLQTPPGSGARHMVFDRGGKYAYVICEMASVVAVFNLGREGDITPDHTYALTDGENRPTGAAAIKYRPADGMVLATNRFADNISLFAADGADMKQLDRAACGRIPRDAAFVPGAELIVAGFQDDGRAALYDISRGKLEQADETAVPKPTCFAF